MINCLGSCDVMRKLCWMEDIRRAGGEQDDIFNFKSHNPLPLSAEMVFFRLKQYPITISMFKKKNNNGICHSFGTPCESTLLFTLRSCLAFSVGSRSQHAVPAVLCWSLLIDTTWVHTQSWQTLSPRRCKRTKSHRDSLHHVLTGMSLTRSGMP